MSVANLEFEPSKADLDILREWLKKTPHVVQDYNDEFLAAFVRGCKGSLQKTKSVLENFNGLGSRYPEFFGHLNIFDPTMQEYLSVVRIFPLPKKTEDGSLVFICAMDFDYKGDPSKVHVFEMYRYWLMTVYLYLWENQFAAGKLIIIVDWTNVNVAHMRDVTPIVLKKIMNVLETSLPIRMQSMHNVNVPPFLEWMLNFVKSFAKKKLADRIQFHSNMETFYPNITKEILPKEYGGGEDDMATLHDRWKKKVEGYSNRLIEENDKMRKLDAIRPKIEDDVDDMAGTFKTLNVD